MALVEQDSGEESESEEESSGINLTDFKPGPPYVCSRLKPLLIKESSKFVKKVYDFDINKSTSNI